MVGRRCRLLLVLCLVVLESAQAWRLEEYPRTNGSSQNITLEVNHEVSEGLFEGDIVLSSELMPHNSANLWPPDADGNVTVGYRFGDNVINKTQVKQAITHWEQNTCIRFQEVSVDVGYAHLNFVDASHCASYVGRKWFFVSGQTIWLHPSCVEKVGSTVHEIGHALGFFHEQSRSDRDDFVKIFLENIEMGKEINFHKRDPDNYGVPYDYSSIMHYGTKSFTSNGKDTILAYNPLAQPLMGNRIGLSFADKLQANKLYDCLGKWLSQCSMTSDPCQNQGYTGPDCKCVCPEGTSGDHCEELEDSYIDALIKVKTPHSEIIKTEREVSSPGYPTQIEAGPKFVKVLVAPSCHKVKLTFTDFQVHHRRTGNICDLGALAIRTSDTLGTEKAYCGEEILPGTVFISETDTIVLDYHNYDSTTLGGNSTFRGFNATVGHIHGDNCTTLSVTEHPRQTAPVLPSISLPATSSPPATASPPATSSPPATASPPETSSPPANSSPPPATSSPPANKSPPPTTSSPPATTSQPITTSQPATTSPAVTSTRRSSTAPPTTSTSTVRSIIEAIFVIIVAVVFFWFRRVFRFW